jgi:hypothetical protein
VKLVDKQNYPMFFVLMHFVQGGIRRRKTDIQCWVSICNANSSWLMVRTMNTWDMHYVTFFMYTLLPVLNGNQFEAESCLCPFIVCNKQVILYCRTWVRSYTLPCYTPQSFQPVSFSTDIFRPVFIDCTSMDLGFTYLGVILIGDNERRTNMHSSGVGFVL